METEPTMEEMICNLNEAGVDDLIAWLENNDKNGDYEGLSHEDALGLIVEALRG